MVPYLMLLALSFHFLCIGMKAYASLEESRRSIHNIVILFFHANIIGTPRIIKSRDLVDELEFTKGYNKVSAIVFILLFLLLIYG